MVLEGQNSEGDYFSLASNNFTNYALAHARHLHRDLDTQGFMTWAALIEYEIHVAYLKHLYS